MSSDEDVKPANNNYGSNRSSKKNQKVSSADSDSRDIFSNNESDYQPDKRSIKKNTFDTSEDESKSIKSPVKDKLGESR